MPTLSGKTCVTWATAVPLLLSRTGEAQTTVAEIPNYQEGGCYNTDTNGQCGKFCKDEPVGTKKVWAVTGYKGPDDPSPVWGRNPFHWSTYADEAAVFVGIVAIGANGFMTVECVDPLEVYLRGGPQNGITTQTADTQSSLTENFRIPGAFSLTVFNLATEAPTAAPDVPTEETPTEETPKEETPVEETPKPTTAGEDGEGAGAGEGDGWSEGDGAVEGDGDGDGAVEGDRGVVGAVEGEDVDSANGGTYGQGSSANSTVNDNAAAALVKKAQEKGRCSTICIVSIAIAFGVLCPLALGLVFYLGRKKSAERDVEAAPKVASTAEPYETQPYGGPGTSKAYITSPPYPYTV